VSQDIKILKTDNEWLFFIQDQSFAENVVNRLTEFVCRSSIAVMAPEKSLLPDFIIEDIADKTS